MDEINISIIIPVYNVEKYLKNNVESLISIGYPGVEFVYIDDGSLDNSVEVLKEYQKKDDRIRLVSRENGGLSAARNTGIQEAKGKWILFVDGDDWVDTKKTEEFFGQIQNDVDIIWGNYKSVTEEKKVISDTHVERRQKTGIKSGIAWLVQKEVDYVPCIYLYKKDFLRKHHISFPEGFLHEDMDFLPRVFYFAKKVKRTSISFYRYVKREGSISRSANYKRSQDLIRIAGRIEEFENEHVSVSGSQVFWKDYRGNLCAEAIHIAIINRGKIKQIFVGESGLKKMAGKYLLRSTQMKSRLAGVLVVCNLYGLYECMYLGYDKLRRK